ncbi:MAG: phosphatase PAP2 family protein [Armatimonadota bacterium]
MDKLQQLDEHMFHLINTGWHWGTFGGYTPLAWLLSWCGRGETQIVLILLVWLGWRERVRWHQKVVSGLSEIPKAAVSALCTRIADVNRGLYVMLWAWASGLLVQIPKNIFNRMRPSTLPDTFFVAPDEHLTTHSFPSGHSWSAAAIAMAITMLFGRSNKTLVICSWILALGVMLSRIYRGVHYPSDVLAGGLMGAYFGWLSWRIVQRRAASPNR